MLALFFFTQLANVAVCDESEQGDDSNADEKSDGNNNHKNGDGRFSFFSFLLTDLDCTLSLRILEYIDDDSWCKGAQKYANDENDNRYDVNNDPGPQTETVPFDGTVDQ